MRSLDLKLFRDLRAMKGQMAAVALVMACGLMVMVMERSLVVSLEGSRDRYYAENRLGDVFCELRRAPNHLRTQLAKIPDVASVETRVRGGAILDIPGMKDSAEASIDRPSAAARALSAAARFSIRSSPTASAARR